MVHALRAAATARPSRGVTFLPARGDAQFESYAALLDAAQRMLGGLHAAGLRQGDAVAMQIADLPSHLHALWGCVLGGIAPVNVAIPPRYEVANGVVQKLLGALDNLKARFVLASAAQLEPLRQLLASVPEGRGCTVLCVDGLDRRSPSAHEVTTTAAPARARCTFSS